MLERLRALGQQRRGDPTEAEVFPAAPTTVEPLPPADSLVDDEQRPTMREIPRDVRAAVLGAADRLVVGAAATREPPAEGVTSKLERIPTEATPAPLPPSPEAEQAAASWFESVPTSPAVSPSIDPFRAGTESSFGGPPLTPVGQRDGAQLAAAPTQAFTRQPRATRGPVAALADKPWAIPTLIAATALAVGMVFGALVVGGGDAPVAATPDAGVCTPCPDPAAHAHDAPDEK